MPSVGLIVLFSDGSGREVPAILTKVHNATCVDVDLQPFPVNLYPSERTSVCEGEPGEPGSSWRWPPRV